MKKREVIIISVILVIAFISLAILYFIQSNRTKAEVVQYNYETGENEVVLEFYLDEDAYYTLEVPYGEFHIEVKDGRYRAIDVDCPNQTCVQVGWVPSLGIYSPIVCLPNGVAINLVE